MIQSKNKAIIAKVPKNHFGLGELIQGQPYINKNLVLGWVLFQLNKGPKIITGKDW